MALKVSAQPSIPQVKYSGNLPSGVDVKNLNSLLHSGIPIVNSSVKTLKSTYPPVKPPSDFVYVPPPSNLLGRTSSPRINPSGKVMQTPVFKLGRDELVQAFKNAVQPTPQITPAGRKTIWL